MSTQVKITRAKPEVEMTKEVITDLQTQLHLLKKQFANVVHVVNGCAVDQSETLMCMFDSKAPNTLDMLTKIDAWCKMADAEVEFWDMTCDMSVAERKAHYEFVLAANMIKYGKMTLKYLEPK